MTFHPELGADIIFMKVGTHAKEDLASILARKRKELEDAGVSFWGYGGGTCHPTTTVRPFVVQATEHGQNVFLCMQEISSHHYAEQERAEEYSADGKKWLKVPNGVNVLGSRYALVIDSLDEADFMLDLAETSVAMGLKRGRSGADYVRGRVDKACLRLVAPNTPAKAGSQQLQIRLAARLADPYAVLLR